MARDLKNKAEDLKNKAKASFKAGNTESAVLQNLQLGG